MRETPAGDAVGGRLCVVERAVYETLQHVQLSLQLVESAGGKAQRDVGHHLADRCPPTSVCVPAGMTSPSTVRFRTDAPLSTRLKRPYSEQLSVRRRPVILCPCPSKSPRKIGIETAGAVRVNVVREHDGQSLE